MNKPINARHFDTHEFVCPCCGKHDMSEILVQMLDQARGLADVPFLLTSAYRCEKHNEKVGGKEMSAHRFGMAVDIATPNSRIRYRILMALIRCGFHRIGIGKDFIHADIDGTKDPEVIWFY